MRNLLALLAQTHRWLLFLALWGVALGWMSTTYSHQRTAMSRWSLRASGSWLETLGQVSDWAQLVESNELVMLENARLRATVERLREPGATPWTSSHARVLRSPSWQGSPWMVLNRGGQDGMVPGAGVLSLGYAAGKIVDTTAHESLVLTLTHPDAQWSVRVGRQGQDVRLLARRGDVRRASVMDVPLAQLVLPGDTVFTTGHDGVFPADILVGAVEDVTRSGADEFQTLTVTLGANFPASRHVLCLESTRNARINDLLNAQAPLP